MRKYRSGFVCFLATLLVALVAGCGQETVTLPSVVSVTPAQGAANVAINATISATFSQAMSAASINASTFTVAAQGGAAVTGTVAYSGTVATFTPTTGTLAYGTTYTATITTGASTSGGTALIGPYVWSFTTIAPSIPAVQRVTPVQGSANVAINAPITATFNMAMSAASINSTTFTLAAPGGVAVPGTVTLNSAGTVATFTPTGGVLAQSTTYTATITTGAESAGGFLLAANYVWTFTTITTPPTVTVVPANGATGVPVNQVLTATFSEAMDCATLNSATFTLAGPGTTPVTGGTVNCSGNVATFALADGTLAYGTLYTATISTGAQNLAGQGVALTVWSFTTITPVPTVINTVPTDSSPGVPAVGVDPNKALTATFNEAMTPDTINSATFLLKATISGAAVNGVVTYVTAGSTATFAPIGGLAYSTQYTATITTGAENPALQTLANPYVWTFTTGAPLTSPPTVTSTTPVTPSAVAPIIPEDVAAPLNQVISATFSEPMAPATIIAANFTLTVEGSTTALPGSLSYAAVGDSLVFVPTAPLLPSTTYTATITTGVTDLAGQPMASNYTWNFMTGGAVSTTAPELLSVVPLSGATGVPVNTAVSATFSEAMNPLTFTSSTFLLYPGSTATGAPVAGTYQYDPVNFIATFTPTNPLVVSSFYTATVTNGAQNVSGIGLGTTGPIPENTWTFETGTAANQAPVLGPTIAAFGGFAGSAGMTNTGLTTVINGDSGTTATGFSAYTGFNDDTVLVAGIPQCVYTETGSNIGLVTGTIYSPLVVPPPFACPDEGLPADITTADAALAEATTAYTTLQGLPVTTSVPLAGQLAGTTINPGVYKNSSSVLITGGDVKLDAQGDPNAYWVFQIGSTLTVGTPTAPSSVILLNGAQAKNVYWAVATDVYLEPSGGGVFNGTIIAYDFIHVSTVSYVNPVIVNGRLISLNASTTLVDTVINVPAP